MREILLHIEDGNLEEFGSGWVWARGSDYFVEADKYQIVLLEQAGLLECSDISMASVVPDRMRITFAGHDYLDSVRDDAVWRKAKEGAAAVGNVTLALMKDIAAAYLRQRATEILGIPL
jgi:hypothetical protein